LYSLAGLLAFVVVLAGCTAFGPNPFNREAAKQPVLQLAYVGPDDHIYIAEGDGSNPRQITRQVSGLSTDQGWSYHWPTYSPDGKRLAFAGYRSAAGQPGSAGVFVADVIQSKATVLLESSELSAIYLYWSPNGRDLAALLQHGSDLVLYLFDASGVEQPRELLVGQPLYWSWAPDGTTIAVHVGGVANSGGQAWVGLLHLGQGGAQQERFADAPGDFRAPGWSASGEKLAYASLGGGQSLLTVRDSTGHVSHVASGPTDVAFTWSPSGEWLAFAYGDPSLPGLFQDLEIARPDGSDRRTLSRDPLVAFYWSPDASRLAAVGFDSGARALTWTVLSVDAKSHTILNSFVPSTDFSFELPFFDQYAQSTNVWSADSKRIVYGSQSGGQGERVMVQYADAASPAAPVADGGMAAWSPPAP
jgi:TolB protein